MLEPAVSSRPSVVALAASIALLGSALGGCQGDEGDPPPRPAAPEVKPQVVAAAPVTALDRASLLEAMDAAASAYATGSEGGDASLVGRRLVVRQAFGCGGPAAADPEASEADGLATWSWGQDRRSLRLTLAPAEWTASPLIVGGGETWEAAEGIWLTRPWMKTSDCPGARVPAPASDPSAPSLRTVGLASVFEKDGSRLGRRNGRAYDYTVRSDSSHPLAAPTQGHRLVLEGRMAAFPDGHAIRCRAASPDQRPVCIGAVQLDRVAFEDATGAVLSEWRGG